MSDSGVFAGTLMQSPVLISQLREARARALAGGRSVMEELLAGAERSPHEMLDSVAASLGMRVLRTNDMETMRATFATLPLSLALERDCVLLQCSDGSKLGVCSDPFDGVTLDWLRARASGNMQACLAPKADIQAYLAKQEAVVRAMDQESSASDEPVILRSDVAVLSLSSIHQEDSRAVRIVNATLYDGLKEGASDVHLKRSEKGLVIKYRLNGVLALVKHIDGVDLAEQMISRLKVLSGLHIDEHRVPQDGKLQVRTQGRDIDVRVSIMPTTHGEAAVLRILDKRTVIGPDGYLHLADLGFSEQTLRTLRHLIAMPYGMLLVTGPTGSGKTTTLYAAISEVNTGRDNFLTIEDPVEYELDDVEQIPVNEKQGLTFATGLRSILRHDPDKIMIGEIRDSETAEMAIQAALTGHAVYSTIHANSSFDVFSRLKYIGVDAYSLGSALNGIWAQRLLRRNCPACTESYLASVEEVNAIGSHRLESQSFRLRRGRGCGECRGTGYKGRTAIAEVISMTDHLREMVAAERSVAEIRAVAREQGTRFLRDVALDMVVAGETTLDEVQRVTLAT
jgi:general secretion pathway protein E